MNRTRWLRISGAISCLVLTLSILCPFLQMEWLPFEGTLAPPTPGPETYWSFRVVYVRLTLRKQKLVGDFWLQDCWNGVQFYRTKELGIGIGGILALMFIVQAFTLLIAGFATLKVNRHLFLSAAILSLLTMLLMWLTSRAFAYPSLKYTFQPGFWLTLVATALFLTIFVAGQVKKAWQTPTTSLNANI